MAGDPQKMNIANIIDNIQDVLKIFRFKNCIGVCDIDINEKVKSFFAFLQNNRFVCVEKNRGAGFSFLSYFYSFGTVCNKENLRITHICSSMNMKQHFVQNLIKDIKNTEGADYSQYESTFRFKNGSEIFVSNYRGLRAGHATAQDLIVLDEFGTLNPKEAKDILYSIMPMVANDGKVVVSNPGKNAELLKEYKHYFLKR